MNPAMKHCARAVAVLVTWLGGVAMAVGPDEPKKVDLFEAAQGGYVTYRIPGIIITTKGTLIAYCEARLTANDWAGIDILYRRSTDNGETWEPPRKIAEPPKDVQPNPVAVARKMNTSGVTMNNPVAIADPSGTIHFLYCINYGRCFYTHSEDDGRTFAEPVEITAAFEKFRPQYDWKVLATGPGHGIRLSKTGRLVVPVWMSLGTGANGHHPSCVGTIFSDDAGKTWQAGEIVVNTSSTVPDPNETTAAELSDGSVMLNTRCESPKHRRVIEISRDGATGWSQPVFEEALPDPICFASLVRVPHPDATHDAALAFSNPANDSTEKAKAKQRINLTVRLSYDDGKTWPAKRLLEGGIAGYSDMAAGPDGTIYCLYERAGVKDAQFHTKWLTMARLKPDWITAAALEGARP